MEKLIELASLEWNVASRIAFAVCVLCALALVYVIISAVIVAIKILITDIILKFRYR